MRGIDAISKAHLQHTVDKIVCMRIMGEVVDRCPLFALTAVCINNVKFRDNINLGCYKIELSLGTSETVPAL